MTRIVLVLLFSSLWLSAAEPTDPKTLDVSADKTKAAVVVIRQLDDKDVVTRDRVTAKLKAMGREAYPAMRAALMAKPADRVIDHLATVLPAAAKAELDARYPVFLADKDRKYEHDLFGWNELKAAAKDTKQSRLLMADILNDAECRDMLVAAFDRTPDGRKQFEGRWETKWKAIRSVTHPSGKTGLDDGDPIHWMPAALLADLIAARDYGNSQREAMVGYYLSSTDEGKLALKDKGKYGPVVREVGVYWIDQQTGPVATLFAPAMALYLDLDPEFRVRMSERHFERALAEKWSYPPLIELAGTKDPKYIADFRRLFESTAVYLKGSEEQKRADIQLRDAALSMCVALSGQDPVEYGFAATTPADAKSSYRYLPHNYHFAGKEKEADEKRTAAFKKWEEWEKANPDKIKAKPSEKNEK